jgi:hypothetical protein
MNSVVENIEIAKCKGGSLRFSPEQNVLLFVVEGFMLSEAFRQLHQKALEYARTHYVCNWLADFRALEAVKDEDIAWICQEWHPQWMNSPVQRVYIIEPQKLFGRTSFKRMISRELISKMNMKFFLDENSAMQAIY